MPSPSHPESASHRVRWLATRLVFSIGALGAGAISAVLFTQSTLGGSAQAKTEGVYYANCGSLLAAGAGPIEMGEPGYRAPLDSDHDGVACEFDPEQQ